MDGGWVQLFGSLNLLIIIRYILQTYRYIFRYNYKSRKISCGSCIFNKLETVPTKFKGTLYRRIFSKLSPNLVIIWRNLRKKLRFDFFCSNQVFKEIYFKINPRKNTFRKIFDTQNKKISPKTNPRKNIFLSKIQNCLWFYERNLFKNWSEQKKPSLNFFSSCAKLSPSLEIVLKISFYIEWVWFSLGKVSNLLKIQDPQKKCFWIFNLYLNIYPYLRYISYYYQEI